MERQNDDKLEGLLGRVKMLKDVSLGSCFGVGDELRLGTDNEVFHGLDYRGDRR